MSWTRMIRLVLLWAASAAASSIVEDDDARYPSPFGDDPRRWTASLRAFGDDVVLGDVVLAGSHNAASRELELDACLGRRSSSDVASSFEVERSEAERSLVDRADADVVGVGVDRSYVKDKTARCQSTGLREQLDAGIRFLDLRVIADPDRGGVAWPLHHTFLVSERADGTTLYEAFSVVASFLSDHDGETVVLRVYADEDCRVGDLDDHRRTWEEHLRSTHGDVFATLAAEHLTTTPLTELSGRALVDYRFFADSVEHEYWPGTGFGLAREGSKYKATPLAFGPYHVDLVTNKNKGRAFPPTELSIVDFFPNAGVEELAWTVTRPRHGGLREWDTAYDANTWVLHDLLTSEEFFLSKNRIDVNVLMTNFVANKPLRGVAERATLYRLHDKYSHDNHTDVVVSTDEHVDGGDEHHFEHRCPPGWIVHAVVREAVSEEGGWWFRRGRRKRAARWRFRCRKVDWTLVTPSLHSNSTDGSFAEGSFHPSVWGGHDHLSNECEGPIRWGGESRSRDDGNGTVLVTALTGVGATPTFPDSDDRGYWFLTSTFALSSTPTCAWRTSDDDLGSLSLSSSSSTRSSSSWIAGVDSLHTAGARSWSYWVCEIAARDA